jgi:hypothetical protein
MSSPKRLLAAVLVLLSSSWCLPQGLMVVCAGENGHMALELVHPPEGAAEARTEPGCAEECACRDGCGPCRDTRVGPRFSASRMDPRRLSPPELAPAASVTPVFAARRPVPAPAVLVLERRLPKPDWIRHQETLRLLI